MSRKLSLFSALVVGAIGPFVLHPGSAGAVPVAGDLDGDRTGGAADCAPLDPSVHPGAPDRPDLAFTDTNCDGVDGDAANAVFVSAVGGNDTGTGTRLNPLATISAGLTAAASAGKDVYVAGGTYSETVHLADGAAVYGGYALGFLSRSAAETTRVVGVGGPAALAVGDEGVVLQQLTLRGRPDGSGNSYGLRAVNEAATPSQVVLENVQATADAAGPAVHGSGGGFGGTGFGLPGGAGGLGGLCAGVPGALGFFGSGSGQGAPGATGANGSFVAHSGATWARQPAASGASGSPGGGGRGGQGGTGNDNFGCLRGGTGGTGGAGGGGGTGGSGGLGGAGSFGVYAFGSSVVAVDSTLTGGSGGAGGNGGNGGSGGFGGNGTPGSTGECRTVFISVCAQQGLPGQQGFAGGSGGGGGGGVGGPSAAVYQGGATSGFTHLRSALDFAGAAALGGLQGNTGVRAASGPTVDVLRTAGAPTTSSFDFDGDGVADPDDVCPADASDGDGCPTAPDTSIVSGPADDSYLLAQSVSVGLGSSKAGSTFACSLDGGDADACSDPHLLSGLSARTHVFRAWATDVSGNADPTATERTFTVPVNNTALSASSGWAKKSGSGYFRDTYSTSTKKAATLSRSVSDAARIALVATKAPGHGKVNVMLGNTLLREVNLNSTTTRKKQVFEHEFTTPRTGTIKLVVATSGKPVRIEGLGVVTQ